MAQVVGFDTNFVELDESKMVHTSDMNFAIIQPGFPYNWRTVSVNGDEIIIATKDNRSMRKTLGSLVPEERQSLEATKIGLTSVIKFGPFSARSRTGFAKLTTFDRNGGSSTSGTGGGASSSSSSSSSAGGGSVTIQKTGPNSFIVSKQNFLFNWHRVFVDNDVVTIVYKNGRVVMLPEVLMMADEKQQIIALRQEIQQSGRVTEQMQQQISRSLGSPMDFVNKFFGGMFG